MRRWLCGLLVTLALVWTNHANAIITIVQSSTATVNPGTTIPLVIPVATAVGDFMIVQITARGATLPTITAPAGWTTLRTDSSAGAIRQAVYYKFAVAGEPGATRNWTLSSSQRAAAGMMVFRGVDPIAPIDVHAGRANAASTTVTGPTITTNFAEDMLVAFFGTATNTSFSPLASLTERYDLGTGGGPNGATEAGGYFLLGAPVTTTRSATTAGVAINIAQLVALRARPAVDHLSITSGGTGITCGPEPITIAAHTSTHTVVTTYTGTITLSTSTGQGDWSIITGSGTLANGTANDGVATYTFAAGDNGSVTLGLRHVMAATVNINATDGVATETTGSASAATDDQTTTFVAAGFRFIDAANIENIGTQIAGKDSDTGAGAQTLYLQAIRTDSSTGSCVGVFPAGSNIPIGLASRCIDPTTCSVGKNIAFTNNGVTTAIAANNNAAPLVYTTVDLLFTTNSRALFKFNSPDVGRMSLHATITISGVTYTGASNAFVVKPFGFTVSNIRRTSDSFVNPAAASAAGAAFIKAGDPFSATVTAIQLNGTATPAYGRETSPESVTLSNALVAPASGLNPVLDNPSAFAAFSNGIAAGTTFAWDEVGIITLTPSVADSDYLGVGNVTGTASANVGRFTPHHFVLSAGPTLTNRILAACTPASTFTYMTEALQLGFELEAQNAAGSATQNYDTANGFAKLNGALPANFGIGAIDIPAVGAKTPLTSRLDLPTSAGSWVLGTGTFTVNAGILRATPAVPDGPYTNVNFGIAPVDSDSVALTPFDLDVDNNAINEHALVGSTEIRYGRMRMQNAYGSELLSLQIPAVAQYFGGGNFLTNVADSCTALPTPTSAAGLTFFGQTAKNQLAAGETTATLSSPIVSGNARLRLSPPGAGNFGFLDAVFTVPIYLQFDWNGDGSYTDNPRSRARFGLFKNVAEFIYSRETY